MKNSDVEEIERIDASVDDGATESINFKAIALKLLSKWYVFAIVCFVSITISILLVNLFSKKFESQMIVFAKSNSSSPGSFLPAPAIALSVPSSGQQLGLRQLLTVINSDRLAQKLAQSGDYMQVAFAGQWDPRSGKWRPPETFTQPIMSALRSLAGLESWYPPDAHDFSQFLSANIKSDIDRDSGALTLTFVSTDPAFAQRLLGAVYAVADSLLNADELANAIQRRDYFRSQLDQLTENNLRTNVFKLIDDESNKILLLQSGEGYKTQIIQSPTFPTKPVSPKLTSFIGMGLLLGIVLSAFIVLVVMRPRRA